MEPHGLKQEASSVCYFGACFQSSTHPTHSATQTYQSVGNGPMALWHGLHCTDTLNLAQQIVPLHSRMSLTIPFDNHVID